MGGLDPPPARALCPTCGDTRDALWKRLRTCVVHLVRHGDAPEPSQAAGVRGGTIDA